MTLRIAPDDFRASVQSGLSIPQLMQLYNCSVDAIEDRLRKFGLRANRNRKWTPEAINRVIDLHRMGISFDGIADVISEEFNIECGKDAIIGLSRRFRDQMPVRDRRDTVKHQMKTRELRNQLKGR